MKEWKRIWKVRWGLAFFYGNEGMEKKMETTIGFSVYIVSFLELK